MKLDIKLNRPIRDIYPKEWQNKINMVNLDNAEFRNLQHFKNYCSQLTQRNDMQCGISYKEALKDLLQEKSLLDPTAVDLIRNLVRSNLLKRGLISEDIYESYKYDIDGIAMDVQKVIDGNPECMLKPMYSYTNYFYELYVNISYPYSISDETIRENVIKLLATIEELERQHIYIKVTLVDVSGYVNNENDLLTIVPLFSYKDYKSIQTMSAIINERLLRKFMFAMSEDVYGDTLASGYGKPITLPNTINIGGNLDEIELFEEIYNKVITPGVR